MSTKRFFERYCPVHDDLTKLFKTPRYEKLKRRNNNGDITMTIDEMKELAWRGIAVIKYAGLTNFKSKTKIINDNWLYVVGKSELDYVQDFIEESKKKGYI